MIEIPPPQISIIMPVHNMAGYVEAAVHSVLEQIGVNLELIAVDDASSDDSIERLRKIRDPRLQVTALDHNQGVAKTRNIALAQARGEWVQFLDPDDRLDPGKLAAQLKVCTDADVIVGNWRKRMAETGHTSSFKPVFDFQNDVFGQILEMNRFPIHAALVRRHIVEAVGGFDPSIYHEDWDLWLKVAAMGARFRYSSGASVEYLIRPDSRCGGLSHRLEQDLAYLNALPRDGMQVPPQVIARARRLRWYHLALNAFVTGRPEEARQWAARCEPLTIAEQFELGLVRSPLTAWLAGKVPGPRKVGRLLRGMLPVSGR